jgi:hypothetical protein
LIAGLSMAIVAGHNGRTRSRSGATGLVPPV